MIREICKDEVFLAQKAELATIEDLPVADDLLDTLRHPSGRLRGHGGQYDRCQQKNHRL